MSYQSRLIGPNQEEIDSMLRHLNFESVDAFINKILPHEIQRNNSLQLGKAVSESEWTEFFYSLVNKNKDAKCLIGQGYAPTITPAAIQRYFFENPGWYTAYTPYQAEISQGRLELLFHYQTMICDLTGLPISNASLLDESTALAEAMSILYRNRKNKTQNKFIIASPLFNQHVAVLKTRAESLGIELIQTGKNTDWDSLLVEGLIFGACFQMPNAEGLIENTLEKRDLFKQNQIPFIICADILSLVLLESPAELGADIAVGSTQRFGVPMGFGGPHAAYLATKDTYKRQLPGRIIGETKDKLNNTAYRMALQTREQHIRREKATSNICTAQALLAMMSALYAIYHGPLKIQEIATNIHHLALKAYQKISALGYEIEHDYFFDTLRIKTNKIELINTLEENHFLVYQDKDVIQITFYEGFNTEDLETLCGCFKSLLTAKNEPKSSPTSLIPKRNLLSAPIFKVHHSELKLMRFLKTLENKDLSLTHSMIALGSCTMKLNPSSAMIPLTQKKLANIHPYSPTHIYPGYSEMIDQLGKYLCEITELNAVSFQPNSGAQGEYAGLMTIKAYYKSKNEDHRIVMLIPTSAHGTNPASAQMAGFDVVGVNCDDKGNIDIEDLDSKIKEYKDCLAGMMITYPSTFGVFERGVEKICEKIHAAGAQVYMDGANLNAQVGLTSPGVVGADICHINLHKTFCIPHGGGGPGMGPICVKSHLEAFLPQNPSLGADALNACSAAMFGSASILSISFAAIKMLGDSGLKKATQIALLNANYMALKLKDHYPILYTGPNGYVAHEFIIDCRAFKKSAQIDVEDIAKRLMDYGFHAPTMSWPIPGCLMIEPTESESVEELDLFCEALISIRNEIKEIETGDFELDNNLLKNAPHTLQESIQGDWVHPYSRERAVFPLGAKHKRIWPSVSRIDNAFGDRNLVCSCQSFFDQEKAQTLV